MNPRKIRRQAQGDRSSLRLAIAWYSRDQWETLKSVAADPDNLDDSYETWVRALQRTRRQLRAQGIEPERVEVKVHDLVEWCREAGRPVDGGARAEYAAELLWRRDHPGEQRRSAATEQ